MRATPVRLMLIVLSLIATGCEPSTGESAKTSEAGDGARTVSTNTSEIPAVTTLPFIQSVDVVSCSIDAGDVPNAVSGSWKRPDEILVRIQLQIEILLEELRLAAGGEAEFDHSMVMLEVGSQAYWPAGEHNSGMWGGPFSTQFLGDTETSTADLDLIFAVPAGAQKDAMRIRVR